MNPEIAEISEDFEIVPHGETEVMFLAENNEELKELKISKFNIKVHSKEPLEGEEIDLPELVKDKERNVYFLLHGWTGTNEIFDIEGHSMVEQILEKDPSAVIICPDGNGFGDTEFEEDLSLHGLARACSPGKYADQFNFLQQKLGLEDSSDKERTFLMGHSMGGAATLMAAAKGYVPPENCIALNPAILFRDVKNKKDFGKRTRETYSALRTAFEVGKYANDPTALKGITKGVIQRAFKKPLGPYLMGEKFSGDLDSKEVLEIFSALTKIHGEQMIGPKIKITHSAMRALARGTMVSKEEAEKMLAVDTITGDMDNLAPNGKELIESYISELGRSLSKEELQHFIQVKNSGHYASVYSGGENSPANKLAQKGLKRKKLLSNN